MKLFLCTAAVSLYSLVWALGPPPVSFTTDSIAEISLYRTDSHGTEVFHLSESGCESSLPHLAGGPTRWSVQGTRIRFRCGAIEGSVDLGSYLAGLEVPHGEGSHQERWMVADVQSTDGSFDPLLRQFYRISATSASRDIESKSRGTRWLNSVLKTELGRNHTEVQKNRLKTDKLRKMMLAWSISQDLNLHDFAVNAPSSHLDDFGDLLVYAPAWVIEPLKTHFAKHIQEIRAEHRWNESLWDSRESFIRSDRTEHTAYCVNALVDLSRSDRVIARGGDRQEEEDLLRVLRRAREIP